MDIFEALKCAYVNSVENIILTDEQLKIMWKNKSSLPDIFAPDDIRLFKGQNLELPVTETITAEYMGGYGASCALRIEPLYEDKKITGYLCHLYSCDDIEQLSDRSGYFNFKSNFLGNIRQELSAVVSMLDCRRQKYIDSGDMDYLLFDREARYRVLRTFSATANLNELTKYYNGYFSRSVLNVSDVLGDLCENAEELFDNNNCTFTSDIAPGIYFECNSDRIKGAISNLLINSFMYNSKEEKTCSLTLSADTEHFVITVSDNGDGIEETAIPNLTKPFANFKSYGEHEALGLVVVAKFCEAFGAKLEISSEVGEYTKITMTFGKPAEVPKQFRLGHMSIIRSPYDLENCIFAKGFNPLK